MANSLRAGNIGDDWSDPALVSLASDMDKALTQSVPNWTNLAPHQRQVLLVGIANGIIDHLSNNAGAFTVQVPDPSSTTGGTITTPVAISLTSSEVPQQ